MNEARGILEVAKEMIAGTMAEFEVRAVRHPDDSVETMLMVNGKVVVSSEEPLSRSDLYERCFKAVSKEIIRHARGVI